MLENVLRNAWYPAAWSDEVGHGRLLGRTLLGEPVVLYRQGNGTPAALGGVCPHRFAPLHMGKQIDDIVQCGYHGLEFDSAGRCVRNPHGKVAPPRARVTAFAVTDRYGVLWIWMGDEAADAELIPDEFAFLEDGKRAHNKGYIHGQANYLLMLDNLMDVSHALYLHSGSLTTEDMRQNYEPRVHIEDGVTSLVIHQQDIAPPPFWAAALPEGTARCDVRETTHGHIPSLVMHEMVYTQPGREPYSEGGVSSRSAHLYTPETESSTHYFFCLSRDFKTDDTAFHEAIQKELWRIFTTEDLPMIEAQQRLVGNRDLMDMRPSLLPTDKASVLTRRHLGDLIAKESGR
jgi:phenylpropionate dioxygenase-like ring-hydroxylating dioxygenase large terminal subunit